MESRKDLITGVLFLIVGVAYVIGAFFVPVYDAYGGSTVIASDFVPKVLGIFLILLSLVEIIKARKDKRSRKQEKLLLNPSDESVLDDAIQLIDDEKETIEDYDEIDTLVDKGIIRSFLLIFTILIAYIALLRPLGFVIASSMFLITAIWAMAPSNKVNKVFTVILSIGVSVLVYILFVYGLRMMLPQGILPF